MTKKIKITIPAGRVTADLPFYCYFVDFSTFPSSFWTDSYNNGGDVRAYDDNGAELPLALMSRYSTVTKTGGCYVRLPVKSAVDTVFYIHYNTLGLVKRDYTHALSYAGVFAGFHFFCDGYDYNAGGLGVAYPKNMAANADNTPMDDGAGTINDGDGPTGSFTFAGNGYFARNTLSDGDYSVGAIAMRAAGVTTDVVICEFGNELVFRADLTCAAEGTADIVGNSYIPGNMMSVGVVHNGDTYRKLFVNAVEAADTALTIGGARFSVGANNVGSRPLKGAIRHAFVYAGLLPKQYYEMETFLLATAGEDEHIPPTDDGDVTEVTNLIIWAGTSIADLDGYSGSITTNTSSTYYRTAQTNEGFGIDGTVAAGARAWVDFAETDEVWFAGDLYYNTQTFLTTSDGWIMGLGHTSYSATEALFRVGINDGVCQLEYWNGSAYVGIGATFPYSAYSSVLTRWDFHVKMSDTVGVFEVYANGALVVAAVLPDTILTAVTKLNRFFFGPGRSGNVSNSYNPNWSSAILSKADTRQNTFYKLNVNAAGTTSGWTGAYTDVDETGIGDTDFLQAAAANLVSTFNAANLPAGPTAATLEAVVVSLRGQAGASAPTKIDGVVRIGSTDYPKTTEKPTGLAYKNSQAIYHLNPATGQPWLGSEANAAEVGVKSVA